MNSSVEIAGIRLEHPVMNAAGTCKLLEDVRKLARSASAAIMVGSITSELREGNSGDTYWAGKIFSLNSLGLPNPGASYYRKHVPSMVAIAHAVGKPLWVSVAGFSPTEYAMLAEVAFDGGADLVELNLGCPNVWLGTQQKRPASFDPELVGSILSTVQHRVGQDAVVAVKMSPFSDVEALGVVAGVIGVGELVKIVTAVNTFPNGFALCPDGRHRITPGGGLAGMAGPALKPIGLGQVRQFRALLPERIAVVGVGGVTHGEDVLEYQRSGAVAVQVATAYLERHDQVFTTLLQEFLDPEE